MTAPKKYIFRYSFLKNANAKTRRINGNKKTTLPIKKSKNLNKNSPPTPALSKKLRIKIKEKAKNETLKILDLTLSEREEFFLFS